MPSIFAKILHRKTRSTSASPNDSRGTPGAAASTISLASPGASARRKRNDLTSPSAPALGLGRQSMDEKASGGVYNPRVSVSPTRAAPAPPTIAVIDHTNDPHTRINGNGQLDPASPSRGFNNNLFPVTPGVSDPTLDTHRELPPLPQSAPLSEEIRDVVDRRQRPIMTGSPNSRQSVEGEIDRQSVDPHGKAPVEAGRLQAPTEEDEDEGEEDQEQQRPRRRSGERKRTRKSLDMSDIPDRGSSLHPAVAVMTPNHPANQSIDQRMADMSLANGTRASSQPAKAVKTLEMQQKEMVDSLFAQSHSRRAAREPLTDAGHKTFERAKMTELVGKPDTVEITTRWLKPVVQETIKPRIHTEYLTVIDRHIHHHDIYPKILPVEDPDPVQLPPVHRIFSPATGQWHEVQGDEAAIAILGHDVFHNGPKELRHVRTPFTWSQHLEEQARAKSKGGEASSSLLSSLFEGMSEEQLLAEGFGTGGKGKVVEREGKLGDKLGDWKPVGRGELFGHKLFGGSSNKPNGVPA